MTHPNTRNDVVVTTDLEALAAVAIALCENALGGKRCPCKEAGKFNCADEYPGQQAQAALTALRAQVNQQSCSDAVPVACGDPACRMVGPHNFCMPKNPAPAVAADGVGEGWRTIETAPQDGTDLLLFDGEHMVGRWQEDWTHGWVDHRGRQVSPLYWMPLTRPTATNGDKDAVIAELHETNRQHVGRLNELGMRIVALREALTGLRDYGCPVCNGDCGSANPPVTECPMRNVAKVLRETKP